MLPLVLALTLNAGCAPNPETKAFRTAAEIEKLDRGRGIGPDDEVIAHFAHPNGAQSFIGVWLAGADLSRERELMRAHGAAFTRQTVHVPDAMTADVARLREGDVVFLPADRQRVKGRPIVGATVQVKSVGVARQAIETGGTALRVAPGSASIFVAPEAANGLWLEFREARGVGTQRRLRK